MALQVVGWLNPFVLLCVLRGQVHIYLDVSKAMADGITFFVSLNNVILSSGKEGFIGPQYFSKVVDIKAKKTIFPEELAGQQQDYGTLDGTGIHV